MALRTRSRMSSDTYPLPFTTSETVLRDTPAFFATSRIPTMIAPSPSSLFYRCILTCLPLILHSFTFSRTCSTVRCAYRLTGAPLTLFPSCDFHDALLKSHSWATFALHSIPHRWNIGLNGLAVSTAALLRSESRQNNAIVGFSTIRGGILQIHISGFETLDEIVRRVDARTGGLDDGRAQISFTLLSDRPCNVKITPDWRAAQCRNR